MGEIVKSLSDGHYLYRFSPDILFLVRRNAHLVSEADSNGLAFHLNLSSIFLAGSFLEAALNEQIAMAVHNSSPTTKLTQQFWITLAEMKKDLTVTDEWNIIAAACGGQQWDKRNRALSVSRHVDCLRNALVHFKGQYTAEDVPPTKRLKSLVTQFKTDRDYKLEAMEIDPWFPSLVKSKELSLWIDSTIFAIHSRMGEPLFGNICRPDEKEA